MRSLRFYFGPRATGPFRLSSFITNTPVSHAAIDERVAYACVSGSAASFRRRMADGTGISTLELIPGIARDYEVNDIVALIAPRRLLVVSADNDRYAADAPEVVEQARPHWPNPSDVTSVRSGHGHDLDAARFELIVDWIAQTAGALT